MIPQSVTILGATGSVGRSTLDILSREPERFRVDTLTAHGDVAGLARAALKTRAALAVIADPARHAELREALAGTGTAAAAGPEALVEAAGRGVDIVVAAIVGGAGLAPVLAAARAGTRIALANKEALVCAGELVRAECARSGATLLTVDSEHSAIFQCFDFERPERVRRIILTASGGPFRCWSRERMRAVTPEQAVAHPNWSMGAKISVDSATMMNKGLEVVEAWHLFPIAKEAIEVVVHPQSVIHSLVDYVDGSVLAQLGAPDMRTPIAGALAWPDRLPVPVEALDLVALSRLDFEAPDPGRFPALRLAREALDLGGAAPAVLNAANEEAVAGFLARRIGFLDIAGVVEEVLARDLPRRPASLSDVLAIDGEARRRARHAMRACAA